MYARIKNTHANVVGRDANAVPVFAAISPAGVGSRGGTGVAILVPAVTRARIALALFALLASLSAIAPGCAAPVLPLPPPTALVEGPPDADGTVLVTGNARAGAFVACLNEDTEAGVIIRADVATGDYALRIPAEVGHTLTLWQFESTAPGGEQVHRTVPAM